MRTLWPLAVSGVVLVLALLLVWDQHVATQSLERRVDRLQEELVELQTRVPDPEFASEPLAAQSVPARVQPVRAQLPTTEAQAQDEPVPTQRGVTARMPEQPITAETIATLIASEDPAIQESVRSLVREVNDAERDERAERRQERWEERTTERLQQLADEVSITPQQQDALFAILTRMRSQMGDAFRTAREDGDMRTARDQADRLRSEADAEAKALLDDKQYAAFQAMQEEERDFGPGRRRVRVGAAPDSSAAARPAPAP